MSIFELIEYIFGNKYLLLIATLISIALKTFALTILLQKKANVTKKPQLFLAIILSSSVIIDSAWVVHLIRFLFLNSTRGMLSTFWIRLSWGFNALLYMTLALLIDTLIAHNKPFNAIQKAIITLYLILFSLFVGIAFTHLNQFEITQSVSIVFVRELFKICSAPLLLLYTLYCTYKKQRLSLPRILKKQIEVFTYWILLPFCFLEFLQLWPISLTTGWITNSYAAVTVSTLLITFAAYYCMKKIIGLRFLNFRGHVETKTRYNFVEGFKEVLKQLSHATTYKELQHFTQMSFKEMFQIPISRTNLYIRSSKKPIYDRDDISHTEKITENFLMLQPTILDDYIHKNHILIYDEIAFSNFYERTENSEKILAFLDALNADMFIPIATQEKLKGYIVVDRFARPQEFYSSVEHNEIAVFASYLANIINLLQTRNLKQLIQREKELQEELYNKHQEINQYKESVRSFLRNSKQGETGIIFYKNRRFTFGNQTAKELININLNQQEGHPITQRLKDLARKVQEYKTPQRSIVKDKNGQRLVLSAVPHLDQNNVIIVVYYPEISDLVKKQVEALRDPSKWDYLLYLETTQSGKLINQLIPGTGEQMLNFKIALLEAALSKKATLLEMPEADLLPTVRLLHHISLRETLHTIKLSQPSLTNDIATSIFGINPIFGMQTEPPLLERLDNTGTIFIQNIHFLDRETQEYLAEYLMYGMFRMFKSEQKIASNVRIVCSTNKNLHLLVQEGQFSEQLFNQLKKHTLCMPSLLSMPEEEIHELAEGYTEQALKADDFKNLLELTDKEKTKIAGTRPISLQEFKGKVQQLLHHKTKKNSIYHETQFDPAYDISDPELTEAARLGKHALRDEKTMILLWNKFKSQSQIAAFLGVNRSSVNRRCKQYNLE